MEIEIQEMLDLGVTEVSFSIFFVCSTGPKKGLVGAVLHRFPKTKDKHRFRCRTNAKYGGDDK